MGQIVFLYYLPGVQLEFLNIFKVSKLQCKKSPFPDLPKAHKCVHTPKTPFTLSARPR